MKRKRSWSSHRSPLLAKSSWAENRETTCRCSLARPSRATELSRSNKKGFSNRQQAALGNIVLSMKEPRFATRRDFLRRTALAGVAAGLAPGAAWGAAAEETITLPFENGERPLVKYPQKRPLIRLTSRPPQLETPFSVFNEGVITPNDAFFVRYHLSGIPLSIDPDQFRLEIKGSVETPLSLSLADLKRFEPVEL